MIRPAVWGLILVAIWLLSMLGLLQIRMSAYDDSALLLGARLLRSGRLPYIDFYTPYGPLGYSLVAASMRLNPNFSLALRAFQGISLAACIALLLGMSRKGPSGAPGLLSIGGVAFSAYLMTNVFWQPPFLGFAFCLAAVAMACLARSAVSRTAARVAAGAGGLALACGALVRPVFAGYALLAVVGIELVSRVGTNAPPGDSGRAIVFLASALLSLPLIWVLLYPRISPAAAVEASILMPARLLGGGGRFVDPGQILRTGFPLVAPWVGPLLAAAIATTLASFVSAARHPSARALAPVSGILGALGVLGLQSSPAPGLRVAFLTAGLVVVGLAAAFSMRSEIRESSSLAGAAIFGLTAIAFGHYFWTRPDAAHLAPALAFAAVSGAMVWRKIGLPRKVALIFLFGILALAAPQLPQRVAGLAARGARLPRNPWPAATVPRDAVEAVRFADQQSDPRSRFVAVASTHTSSSGNPVRLFLFSSRLPYTRWYTYEPGLQSSSGIQAEMAKELSNSGSRAAVVWQTGKYLYEPKFDELDRKTPFDEMFDRLYPIRAAQFGEYEVRLRAE